MRHLPLFIFAKRSILDLWQASEYRSLLLELVIVNQKESTYFSTITDSLLGWERRQNSNPWNILLMKNIKKNGKSCLSYVSTI